MDIISELKWILIKRENQKSIIVDREFQDYPPGSLITTDKGTLGKFLVHFGPSYEQLRLLVELGWVNFVKFGLGLG